MGKFLSLKIPMIAIQDGESWEGRSESLSITIPPMSRADCLEQLPSEIAKRTRELVLEQGHRVQYFSDIGICSAILGTPGPDEWRLPGIPDGTTRYDAWNYDVMEGRIEGKLHLTIQIDERME